MPEDEGAALVRDAPLAAVGQPGLFDGEQVREVGSVEQFDGAVGGLLAEVAHHQVLAHAPSHVTAAFDHQVGVRPPRPGERPGDERRRVRIRHVPGQGLQRLAVNPEGPA